MYNKVQLFVQKEYNIFFSQKENILGEILKGTKGVLDVSSFHFYSPSELNPSWFFSVPNLMDLTNLRVRCLRGRLMMLNGQNRNSHYDIIAFYNHQRNAMYSPLRPRSKKRGKIRTLNHKNGKSTMRIGSPDHSRFPKDFYFFKAECPITIQNT